MPKVVAYFHSASRTFCGISANFDPAGQRGHPLHCFAQTSHSIQCATRLVAFVAMHLTHNSGALAIALALVYVCT